MAKGKTTPANSATSLATIYQARKAAEAAAANTEADDGDDDGGGMRVGHIPSSHEREVREFKKLNREKSFDEARSAVQSQIERIFQKAKNGREVGERLAAVSAARKQQQLQQQQIHQQQHKQQQQHLKPTKVPVVTPLPVSGGAVTLQTLLLDKKKKRHSQSSSPPPPAVPPKSHSADAATSASNSSSARPKRSSKKKAPAPQPFVIHSRASSTLSRHMSMEDLRAAQPEAARPKGASKHSLQQPHQERYTSMMNLNVQQPQTASSSATSGSKGKKRKLISSTIRFDIDKTTKSRATTSSAVSEKENHKMYYEVVAARHPPVGVNKNAAAGNKARDANLHHLGRMSPEEQLDKFLQSVEEVNAESELILAGGAGKEARAGHKEAAAPKSPKKNAARNLRRENSSVANRWHSMDNLSNSAKRQPQQQPQIHGRRRPDGNGGKAAASPSSRPQQRSTPTAVKSRGAPPPPPPTRSKSRVAFREINGPKSFSSMSQLDNLRNAESPMHTTSSSSHGRASGSSVASTSTSVAANTKPVHRTNVSYLGSVGLGDQASDLTSLQSPLKDMYYRYLAERQRRGATASEDDNESVLEITESGIRVVSGDEVLFNPFPSIAVWAAVRFVYKRADVTSRSQFLYAFLPLISDPGDSEKDQLFHPLPRHQLRQAMANEHPAMFACIMRRRQNRKLECHGFVCQSKEDAIMIAANLYKSLMETIKTEDAPESRPAGKRRPRSSDAMETSTTTTSSSNTLARRRSEVTKKNNKNNIQENVVNDNYQRSTRKVNIKRSVSERRLGNSDSEIDAVGNAAAKNKKGDVYTRVAMPRSKSFMNVSGQYNLQELFRELKEKEGIESVDDILRHVISKDGMSFNKTSPVYRELLMKLAMSMSGDEMFIRSKNIMMQEKAKASTGGGGFARVLSSVFGIGKKANNNNNNNANSRLTKASIGDPMPVSDEVKRELARQWDAMGSPLAITASKPQPQPHSQPQQQHPSPPSSPSSSSSSSSSSGTNVGGASALDYATTTSCSECNSVCAFSQCSCSVLGRADNRKAGGQQQQQQQQQQQRQQQQPPPDDRRRRPAGGKAPARGRRQMDEEEDDGETTTTLGSSSCSTCTCRFCGAENTTTDNASSSTCYSCSSEIESTVTDERRGTAGHKNNLLAAMDSPQTAWRRRNEEITGRRSGAAAAGNMVEATSDESSEDEETTENDDDDDGTTSNTSVMSVVARDCKSQAASSSPSSIVSRGAEHDDGFFRNLNAMSGGSSDATHPNANSKAGGSKANGGGRMSDDSLTSTSDDEDDDLSEDSVVDGRRGPRPAYSEANMQNSLGYLP